MCLSFFFFFFSVFWVGKDGVVCTWTCCSFFSTQYTNPKLSTALSKFVQNNKAEETEFCQEHTWEGDEVGPDEMKQALISSFIWYLVHKRYKEARVEENSQIK